MAATDEAVLAALDKPRSLAALMIIVAVGGSHDALQSQLMRMRAAGSVTFSITTGKWQRSKASTRPPA